MRLRSGASYISGHDLGTPLHLHFLKPLGGDAMVVNQFEIPQTMRNLSEQSLKQAHAAYEQFTDFLTKATSAWMDAMPANPVTDGFKDVQGRVMEFAVENAESAFTFAGQVCNAKTPQDIMALQTQYSQERVQAFVAHTQHLFSAMGETFPKPDGGVMGNWVGALPSIPVAAGFEGVQDRAVAMASKNAESAAALAGKIAKTQSFTELLTLQARFAEEHMGAYATQMQELQKLIEEALQKPARA
jgi:hypothetical protein